MFGFKKDKDNFADDLQGFLEEADALYIKAFETRSIGLLKNHFTRECCYGISRWILAEASSRYFSDAKFRETTWDVVERTDTHVKVIKKCVYRDIRISFSRSMKVSDDYKECWDVDVTPDEYWVSNVYSL